MKCKLTKKFKTDVKSLVVVGFKMVAVLVVLVAASLLMGAISYLFGYMEVELFVYVTDLEGHQDEDYLGIGIVSIMTAACIVGIVLMLKQVFENIAYSTITYIPTTKNFKAMYHYIIECDDTKKV